ncbi:MAG: glycosyltransferase [Planctomycetaceae bacterium]
MNSLSLSHSTSETDLRLTDDMVCGHSVLDNRSDIGSKSEIGHPLRVCHISLTLCTGGLERLLVEFARHHDRERFELSFVVLQEQGQPADDIRHLGCEVLSLPLQELGRWERFRKMISLCHMLKPDVLHTHNAFPHWYGAIAGAWCRVPAIVHSRHGRRFGQNWKEKLQFALASRLSDRVVGVSDDTSALCRAVGRLSLEKVTRIWNGIDLDRFTYRGPNAKPVGISVGRLSAEKDFPTLIHAVSHVREVLSEFEFYLVGDGPERSRLEALAQELELDGCLHFLGERQDVPELLASSTVYAGSSLTEGISLTLLEAMAVGLPVVATNVGGNPEIVIPGETGALVETGDSRALAEEILKLCLNPWQAELYGRHGRSRVEQHFSIQGMVRQYESLYRTLLNNGVSR